MSKCPHCVSSESQTRAGHTRTGSQRYKCRECQRVYTPEPKPLGYPEETKRQAVRLYLEGTNFRRIGRVLSVNHQTVVNWINSYHAALPAAEQSVTKPQTLEMAELFTFIGSKKRALVQRLMLVDNRQHVPALTLFVSWPPLRPLNHYSQCPLVRHIQAQLP